MDYDKEIYPFHYHLGSINSVYYVDEQIQIRGINNTHSRTQ